MSIENKTQKQESKQGALQDLQDSVNRLKELLKDQEKKEGLLKMTPLTKEWNNFLNQ